ncbi:ATP-binding protein [Prosthecomicrobium hirschii]|uniref:ATP-binding protein n=1 Tax=Prosthecodimorpha hirschii TaxID=665126 RepID=A0A0P6WG52_9HYPH|nr:amino acid ABC transporter ATP-binding protein [Prosthecomicrobium hirschii]KPL55420.1 ATP-binding protein [Prosthecomicrobium hirschii]
MTSPEPVVLSATAITKRFGTVDVLKGVDLTVRKGERIAILGSSGSGKSTLLRCLNLLERPTGGTIALDGRTIGRPDGKGCQRYDERELDRVRTRVGMVFQQFNLFPHMRVIENVMEAPRGVLGKSKAEAQAIAERQLAAVGLAEKATAWPAQLSGGQQQRVAIARALAMDPEVLLLDEPTSSLDPELVGEVLAAIRALSDEGRTMLIVTHELGFAFHFATRVLFLHDGKVLEEGPPEQVLKAPREERTRRFIERFTERRF